jgi:hypothetical protein
VSALPPGYVTSMYTFLLPLLLALHPGFAGPTTVRATAKSGVTMASLQAAGDPVLVASIQYEETEWSLKCAAIFEPNDEPRSRALTCVAKSKTSSRTATTVAYIGETEKNLSLRFDKSGSAAGFMVEISGVNAGY